MDSLLTSAAGPHVNIMLANDTRGHCSDGQLGFFIAVFYGRFLSDVLDHKPWHLWTLMPSVLSALSQPDTNLYPVSPPPPPPPELAIPHMIIDSASLQI